MITNLADFCVWMFVLVDDAWVQIAPALVRPGPCSRCTDSELIAMALLGECRGLDKETDLLSWWREPQMRALFPHVPERSRFNRRRRNLLLAINAIRQGVLTVLDLAQDRQCAIDSLPIPVMGFHLVPGAPSAATWKSHGAAFGKVPTKKQTIFGYKLHLLVTLNGVIRDFALAPANAGDLAVGTALLREHAGLVVLGDKGYISAAAASELREAHAVHLLTIPRRNQHRQLPAAAARRLNGVRQIIETVNDQLTEQFAIAAHHAHTFRGLCARLYTKLTAHTLCIYLNRCLGHADFLHLKRLAFPN